MEGKTEIKFKSKFEEYTEIPYSLHEDDDKYPSYREISEKMKAEKKRRLKIKERMRQITKALWGKK